MKNEFKKKKLRKKYVDSNKMIVIRKKNHDIISIKYQAQVN